MTASTAPRGGFRRLTAATVLIAGALLGSLACSDSGGPNNKATGGTLVISVGGDPETLLPVLASTVPSSIITDLVYDRLAEIGDSLSTAGDQGFKPRLAKSWTWSPDSLAIAFHLDSTAKWHDGQPVTAEDVRFTWRLYVDSTSSSPYSSALAGIDSVVAADKTTAVFWFKERSPLQFYDAVNTMSILPEHLLKDSRGTALATAAIARAPVGSGRFRFVKWNPGQSIELAADTANYRSRPGLDRVIMTIAPDFNTQLARLLGGEADMIEQVPAANVADISKDTAVRAVFLPGLDYNFVQLNLRDRKGQRAHSIFGEREVRRALTAALDRPKIVQNAYESLAAVSIGPTVRAYPTTDTTLRQIAYSPEAAKRTLDSLGWKDGNGDGIRERNGLPLAFKLSVPGSSKSRVSMAVLIQEQLKQVGAKVDIEPLERAAFVDMQTRGDFDAMIGGWHAEPSPGGIRQTWGSAGSRNKGGNNYGSYENAGFDAHVDSAMASGTLAARRTYFTKAYQTIIDDAPAIWLAEPRLAVPVHKRFNTPGMRADAWWINIADWTIPADKRIARDRILPAR